MGERTANDDILDNLPEWASIPELLTAIEEEIGSVGRQHIENMLEGRQLPEFVNVRDLLSAIQQELDSPLLSLFSGDSQTQKK
ncbi:unnamed protein product [Sphagnum troendelagicum]|uniref:Uncharacterized protein n=1 Tax=Sphagnum troendelagicum TaxID=128251 RepID=A0ABP0TMW1_9BRYO